MFFVDVPLVTELFKYPQEIVSIHTVDVSWDTEPYKSVDVTYEMVLELQGYLHLGREDYLLMVSAQMLCLMMIILFH